MKPTLLKKPSLVRERVTDAEWQLRCELAAAHRLVAHFVFVDMTYNHISARVPGEASHFLVKADNVFMEQVTASNLVKYDVDGNKVMESEYAASPAAYNVHAAVMKARPILWRRFTRTHRPISPSPHKNVACCQSLSRRCASIIVLRIIRTKSMTRRPKAPGCLRNRLVTSGS